VAELLVALGQHLVHDLARGRGPGVASEEHRSAEVVGNVDHQDLGAVLCGAGACGEAGHAASQDEEIDTVEGPDCFGHGPCSFGELATPQD
jgi:hypothetical protein